VTNLLQMRKLVIGYYATFDKTVPTTANRMPPYVLRRLMDQWWFLEVSRHTVVYNFGVN